MADLIDRAALGIGKANPGVFEKPEYADGWNSAIEIIQNAPAVDAVEVVRCKYCKYWQVSIDRLSTWCPILIDKETVEDDFCSYGERKEDG